MKTLSSLCEDDDDDDVECWAEPGWAGRQSRSWSILVSVGKLISVIRVISIIYPRGGRSHCCWGLQQFGALAAK